MSKEHVRRFDALATLLRRTHVCAPWLSFRAMPSCSSRDLMRAFSSRIVDVLLSGISSSRVSSSPGTSGFVLCGACTHMHGRA